MTGARAIPLVALVVGGGIAVACGDSPMGPLAGLSVAPREAEVVEGGSLRVSASWNGTLLAPNEVVWISRDPSTAQIADGRARGVFPGVTHLVAMRGRARDSVEITVRFANTQHTKVGIRVGGATFELMGIADVQRSASDTSIVRTTVLASPDGLERPGQLGGNTVLQLAFHASPTVGRRTLSPPHVEITEGPRPLLLIRGAPDELLVIMRVSDTVQHLFIPVRPATLQITRVVMPAAGGEGVLAGWLSFEAAPLAYVRTGDLEWRYAPAEERTRMVYAEFSVALRTP